MLGLMGSARYAVCSRDRQPAASLARKSVDWMVGVLVIIKLYPLVPAMGVAD